MDQCFAGECTGVTVCGPNCVSWQTEVGVTETLNGGLRRTRSGEGWTSGAVSFDAITTEIAEDEEARGGVSAVAGSVNNNIIFGLGPLPEGPAFANVAYGAFLTSAGRLFVYENGVFKATAGTYTVGDTISVQIGATGAVEVLLNARVVYTSAAPPEFPLRAMAYMFSEDAALQNISWVGAQEAQCRGVRCPSASDCLGESRCVLGTCSTQAPLNINGTCDDNDETTRDETCNAAGVCVGIPKCRGVVCPPAPASMQCMMAPPCFLGECPELVPVEDGLACNDGNNRTIDDVCVNGECQGTDPCDEAQVPEPQTCRSTQCFLGEFTFPLLPAGTACDDGQARTDFDTCTAAGDCGAFNGGGRQGRGARGCCASVSFF